MAHALKITCPDCKRHLSRFEVEFSLIGGHAAFVFIANCPNCEKPVYTCIGTEVFAEWAARDKFEAPPQDASFLREMNILWEA